jgi:hypothetical protein
MKVTDDNSEIKHHTTRERVSFLTAYGPGWHPVAVCTCGWRYEGVTEDIVALYAATHARQAPA